MEQLIELLQQIQELSGVAIDALKGASKGAGGSAPEGSPQEEAAESPAKEKAEMAAGAGDQGRRY